MNDYFRIEMSLFYETKDGNAKVERSATNFFPKNYFILGLGPSLSLASMFH